MKIIPVNLPEDHNLFLFGDDHEGSLLRYKKGWVRLLHMMNSEYAGLPASRNFGWHHGDPMEQIMVDDRRYYLPTVTEAIPTKQKKLALKNLMPIKDKLIGISEANHDRKLWKFGNLVEELCEELDVHFGTLTTKLLIYDLKGRLLYKTFHCHGRKTINSTADDPKRRKTNMELILKRHLKFKMGDCVLMCKGHTHKLLICTPDSELWMTDDGRKIKQRYTMENAIPIQGYIHPDLRWYVNTGSFLRLYGYNVSGYGEAGEYDPVELGFAVERCRNGKIVGIDKVVV